MKQAIPYWQMGGFVFTAVVGTLLHFLFDWTGGNVVVALFSAVNESTWEHMKLLYWPMLLFALLEYGVWGREQPVFWCIKLLGSLTGLVLIPALFYTYTGVFGQMVDWINIAIFFVVAAFVFWLETILFQRRGWRSNCRIAFAALCFMGVAFWVLTFRPASIPLFEDPVTGSYGYRLPESTI